MIVLFLIHTRKSRWGTSDSLLLSLSINTALFVIELENENVCLFNILSWSMSSLVHSFSVLFDCHVIIEAGGQDKSSTENMSIPTKRTDVLADVSDTSS